MRHLVTVMTLGSALLAACKPAASPAATAAPSTATAASTAGTLKHPEWVKKAVIYEVNIRQYTKEGTFAAFSASLPRLKDLGVDILWIMPVQRIGKVERKGTLGSYYSIADYRAVNPEFGTEADFKAMVAAAHAAGFKVILDWVANHTSFDHVWTKEHKDWYTLRKDGTISRAIDQAGKETDWSDVADLNYDSRPMRAAMISDMKWWVENTGIDGFRCDVAGFVPYDFWQEMRAALDPVKPDLFFLAEWEDPLLHTSFDMTYGWDLFHTLNDVAAGKAGAPALDAYFARQDTAYTPDDFHMFFTSNHDENSWNGTEFERMGDNNLPAFIIAATARAGMPLIYSGQEVAFKRRLAFFEKDSIDWTPAPAVTAFYKRVVELRHAQEPLWNGTWGGAQTRLTTNGGDRVFAFSRTSGSGATAKSVVVFTNFDGAPKTVSFSGLTVPGGYTDWFSSAAVALDATGTIEIPAHGYRVLVH